MTDAVTGVPDDTTVVVSEDEGTMVTLEEIVSKVFSLKVLQKETIRTQLHYHQKSPKPSLFVQQFSLPQNRIEKDCAVCFQDRYWNTKKK